MPKCVFEDFNNCGVLTCKMCSKCSFKKTKEELEAARTACRERLRLLPEEQFKHIVGKYYAGNMR